jgi:hypothetical protein
MIFITISFLVRSLGMHIAAYHHLPSLLPKNSIPRFHISIPTPRMAAMASTATSRTCLVADQITLRNSSHNIPTLMYGTAWKKDKTVELVYQAIKAGFRGIDTAAQPRHYQEHLVGEGIRRAISEGIVQREELFVRSLFSSSLLAIVTALGENNRITI